MTVMALPALEAAGGAEAGGAVAARAGSGKVIDAKVVSSKPLNGRNTRTVEEKSAKRKQSAKDVTKGVGLGQIGSNLLGKGKAATEGTGGAARKLLVAEFLTCIVVLGFSPLTGKTPSAGAFMKRGSAIMGLFFLLGLTATAGRGASRAAAGFGGLVTLVLLISDRSIFTKLTAKFAPGVGEEDPNQEGPADEEGIETGGDNTDQVPDTGAPPVVGPVQLFPRAGAGPLGNGIR